MMIAPDIANITVPIQYDARTADDWRFEALQLIGGKVLIERDTPGERMSRDSRIIIPEMARGWEADQKRWGTGRIRAMGPGMKVGVSKKWKRGAPYRWPMPPVPINTRVIYRTWAVRASFERDGKKYEVVSDEVIDVVINEEEITMATFRPLFDRVLVKRLPERDKTAGGIIIPDIAKEKPVEGEVLAVGPGRIQENGEMRPLDMVVGDCVLFGKFAGTEIKVEGVECVILREEDILGIIDRTAKPEGAAAE